MSVLSSSVVSVSIMKVTTICARPILDIAGEACCQVILTSINGTVQSIVVIGIALAHTNSSLQFKMKFPLAVTMTMTV